MSSWELADLQAARPREPQGTATVDLPNRRGRQSGTGGGGRQRVLSPTRAER